jgi:hypothetical protein
MAATQFWHSAGLRMMLQILNGVVARPATLYLLLRQLDGVSGHPADAAAADTLTSNLSEVTTVNTGYARIAVTNNSTNFPEAASGANSLITELQQTYTFTGAGLPVNGITHSAQATSSDNTGVLLCSAPLSVTRNVAVNDQLKVTFSMLAEQGV